MCYLFAKLPINVILLTLHLVILDQLIPEHPVCGIEIELVAYLKAYVTREAAK